MEKKEVPVEKDPSKIAAYCCGSNILKEGQDVKLGPDSEYPEWLFKMHLGKNETELLLTKTYQPKLEVFYCIE